MGRGGCRVDGCTSSAFLRELCNAHYCRWKRHGDPTGGGTARGALPKFLQFAKTFNGDECLLWPYGTNGVGYGMIRINKKAFLVNRIVCEHINGLPTDHEMMAIHSCGNGGSGCVSPRHLRWGTRQDNADDAVMHGDTAKGERNGSAKLTERDIAEIRKLRGLMTHQKIADMFGINKSHARKILDGSRWGWLDETA